MAFRDRQGLSPLNTPNQSPNKRDRYLDNCFLLCINPNDETDTPEIHRLENHLMRELCQNQLKSQSSSRHYIQDQRGEEEISENYDSDEEDFRTPKQRDYDNRRKENPQDREVTNRSRYQRDNYYNSDQYSRSTRYNNRPRDDYNIMQHSDDELSVYEVYVPTNTLNRLSDKRIDNNMVLIDYEDVRGPSSPYGYAPRNIPSQYNNYPSVNQYNDYGPPYSYDPSIGYPKERDVQQQQQQQRFGGYYGNEGDRQPYSLQSGPFMPPNGVAMDRSNAINVRRHIYSPSQLPQGLTEGQLVMLLQKGQQYQPDKSSPVGQFFPNQKEPQPSTTSAVTVSHQSSTMPVTHTEPFKNPEYISPAPIKTPQVPPQIIDHQLIDDDTSSIIDEITKPMSTLNTTHSMKPSRDIEVKESEEKKKDKSSDAKKDKKAEKDTGGSSKKDSKKEKSSGKDSKKKKK